MEAFKKFDEPRGAVTPELLNAIFAKMEAEPPAREELEAFIKQRKESMPDALTH